MLQECDIGELVRLYVEERMNIRQISAKVGIPKTRLNRYLKEAGVQFRTQGYETIPFLDDKEWLFDQYVRQGKNMIQIGAEQNCAPCTIVRWMKIHGIEARHGEPGHKRNDTTEVREKMRAARVGRFNGSDNPNWKGGVPRVDPERNRYPSKMWVKAVKERDGHKCVECGATGKMHAHHIKRWRDYPELRYEVSNGKTLCEPCHEAAHGRGFKFPWNRHAGMPTSAPPLPKAG